MKAIKTISPRHSVIVDVPKPELTDDYSVLIKMKYCGVCCSEHYDWGHAENGAAFGHEPMGIVEAVGKNVKHLQPGDRVVGLWGSGMPGSGGMVEYALANTCWNTLIKAPEGLRDVDLVVEPLACMLSAVSKMKCSMPGTRVCVVGCGYMGCGVISLLKLRGCYVVAVDVREASLQNALKYGADEALTPEEALDKYIHHGPHADTIDAGFEMVTEWGENDESLGLAIKLVRKCGQLCVGAYHTGPSRTLNMQELGVKAIELLNTHPRENDLLATGAINAVDMLARGQWSYKNIPTMVFPMSKFDEAQASMETKYGKFMKAVIDMTWEDGEPYMEE